MASSFVGSVELVTKACAHVHGQSPWQQTCGHCRHCEMWREGGNWWSSREEMRRHERYGWDEEVVCVCVCMGEWVSGPYVSVPSICWTVWVTIRSTVDKRLSGGGGRGMGYLILTTPSPLVTSDCLPRSIPVDQTMCARERRLDKWSRLEQHLSIHLTHPSTPDQIERLLWGLGIASTIACHLDTGVAAGRVPIGEIKSDQRKCSIHHMDVSIYPIHNTNLALNTQATRAIDKMIQTELLVLLVWRRKTVFLEKRP